MEPEAQTTTIQPDDPLTLLRGRLADINSEARVEPLEPTGIKL